jgi:ribosomal-protein-alanine N-acetyltransferase
LAKALADAKEKDGHELTLEVNVRNTPAISLYLKAGLKELGRREKFYNNQDDALIMGITL